MKPNEYWDSTYREINVFVQSNICSIMDKFRQDINLQEAVTNKIIMADAMSNEKPKIISLLETFKDLFPKKKNKVITSKELTQKMREIMKSDII